MNKEVKSTCAIIVLVLLLFLFLWLRLDDISQRLSEIDASMSIVYE